MDGSTHAYVDMWTDMLYEWVDEERDERRIDGLASQ